METSKIKRYGEKHGFVALLIILLLMLAFFPFLNQNRFSQLFFHSLFSLSLTVAYLIVSTTKRRFYMGLLLILPSLITRWLTLFSSDPIGVVIYYIVTFFFLSFILFFLSQSLFTSKVLTINTVYEATCIYILLGISWAIIFALIHYLFPHAFSGLESQSFGTNYLDSLTTHFESLLYFSYVTLTTLGYGDITPALPSVKFLSILEAITGQIYIATVIARVLGIYLSQNNSSSLKR